MKYKYRSTIKVVDRPASHTKSEENVYLITREANPVFFVHASLSIRVKQTISQSHSWKTVWSKDRFCICSSVVLCVFPVKWQIWRCWRCRSLRCFTHDSTPWLFSFQVKDYANGKVRSQHTSLRAPVCVEKKITLLCCVALVFVQQCFEYL